MFCLLICGMEIIINSQSFILCFSAQFLQFLHCKIDKHGLSQCTFSSVLLLHVSCGNFTCSFVSYFSLLFKDIALYGRLCCAFSFNQENILESTYEKQESVFYIHILKLSAVIFLINVSKFLFVISFGFRGFISLIFLRITWGFHISLSPSS